MKILAIDASSKSTGIAIFQDTKLIHYQCLIQTESDSLKRIRKMTEKIINVVNIYKPTNIIMEEVLPQDVNNNQKTFKVLIYLQALFVITLFQKNHFQNVQFYVSGHWRKLCGIKTGRGIRRDTLKKASIDFVYKKYGMKVNDDISDAICLGWAYAIQHASAF